MDKLENEINLKQSVLEAAERLQTTMYDRQTFPMMDDKRNLLKNQLDSMYHELYRARCSKEQGPVWIQLSPETFGIIFCY